MTKHIENFWNSLASHGNYRDALVGWYDDHNSDEREQQLLFRKVDTSKKDLVALDFGCGPGRCIVKFKDLFKKIDGADVSAVILEKAKNDLNEFSVEIPNLYLSDGKSLTQVPSDTYDVVYSIICMQHISSRDWRLSLYKDIHRVLKDNGVLTFQMGYGPGHPISVDYFHNYGENESSHYDTRVENFEDLKKDLFDNGFTDFDYIITPPTHDQHPEWIWVTVRKK